MRPSFIHSPVNGLFEDPVVYVQFLYEKRAILFDAGDIDNLTPRQINKLTDVFITHTHIDHFIGFDKLLRVLLRRPEPVNIYGPEGITKAVKGKLSGYTWNLVEEYPLVIFVKELVGGALKTTKFPAEQRFSEVPVDVKQIDNNILLQEPLFSVSFARVNHGIPVLAFAIKEPFHINIDKERLKAKGLPVGPWLSRFKTMIREGRDNEPIEVGGRTYSFSELMDIVRLTEGQKVSYVVDMAPTEENISAVIELVEGSHTLYIEAYFLKEDADRALQRNHLTADIAGYIARRARVKEVRPLHLSPKYRDCPERVISEVMLSFRAED